jgi:hypothetical protein
MLTSLDSRSKNARVHPVIVVELELGDRHKGQAFGNKPNRQGYIFNAPEEIGPEIGAPLTADERY